MEELKLKISSSPHVRSKDNTADIMFDVILALVPATVFGIYQFGWYAALLVAVCIVTSVLAEFLFEKGVKKKVTVGDFSAVLTGLLIALNLPPTFPIWMAMLGCIFAIIVVKQLFGGLGQNFMNPALGARCFLLLAFSKYMTSFVYDGVTTATPLAKLNLGATIDIKNLFIGKVAGTIGEVSTAALLLGAAYLLIKKVISPRIPLVYIGTFMICIVIYAFVKDKDVLNFTLTHLCGGGLMLGAWFMATDYVTSPITPVGKIIFGIMLGLLTFVLRIFGSSTEGVSYAIIISNLFVPLIEKATVPKAFGEGAENKDKKTKKSAKNTEDKETEKSDLDEDEKKADESKKTAKHNTNVKGILKAVAALFVITAVMGAGLGVAYDVTKEPIEKVNEKAKQDAYREIFPDLASVQDVDSSTINYDKVNEAFKTDGYASNTCEGMTLIFDESGAAIGIAVTITNSDGYGGDITLVVGYNSNNAIVGVSFIDINETVGLGMEAKNKEFRDQFIGMGLYTVYYSTTGSDSGDCIDALSGATITTAAVTDAVSAANYAIAFCSRGGAE